MPLIMLCACLLAFLPKHEFHTSLMNFNYQDDKKSFEIDLTIDTEHFEEAVNSTYYTSIFLGELHESDSCDFYMEAYINKYISTTINRKDIRYELDFKEVTYGETVLHFEPICFRRPVKKIEMHNQLMITNNPSTKNLIKVFYKAKSKNMLFDKDTDFMSIEF